MNPSDEIEALEGLISQILKGLQDIIQSGEILTDEFQGLIAQELTATTDRIDFLRTQVQNEPTIEEAEQEQAQVANELTPQQTQPATPTGGPIPPLDAAPHESSNINAFKYEPESGKLYVKFQGKYPHQNGPVYSYDGVPKNIYEIFRRGAVGPRTSGRNAWHTWKKDVLPSHGAAMYQLIREGGYPYQRLS